MQASFDDNARLQAQLKLAETDIEHMEKERQVMGAIFSSTYRHNMLYILELIVGFATNTRLVFL